MKITLQEKYICFALQDILNTPTYQYFKLINEVSSKLKSGNYQPTDEIEVEIGTTEFITIYFDLGQKPEYLVASINEQMKVSITSQLTQKITAYMTLLVTMGVDDLTQEEVDALSPADQEIVKEGREAQVVVTSISNRDTQTAQRVNDIASKYREILLSL